MEKPAYEKAVESLRRLGAKMHSTNVTASSLLRWYLSIFGYDLAKAGGGLIGLSNSLTSNTDDWDRASQTNSIQVGLRLPRDYSDEHLHLIESTKEWLHGA